jgi:anti-sigma B factor antagonist
VSISASVNRSGGVATVVVSGEIDVASGPTVEHELRAALSADGVDTVVVDLSAVRFLDSYGVGLLLKGRRLADEQGTSYRVTGADGIVRRVLELGGVWDHLCGTSDQDMTT